jgi:hypothetical protein
MRMGMSMRLSHFPMLMGSLKMGMLKQKTIGFQGMFFHPPFLPFPCLPNFGASLLTILVCVIGFMMHYTVGIPLLYLCFTCQTLGKHLVFG